MKRIESSFRDPSGFIFIKDGILYRQINRSYKDDYDCLMQSGLYRYLCENNLLIPHQEIGDIAPLTPDGYKIIRPDRIPYISYPYEWCFSQLKIAALTTLKIQKIALDYDMTLKDGSAFNIQFIGCKPIFIDTLSFERYSPGQPWVAYRQFCEFFLSPLALMALRDIRLNQVLKIFINGIPLDFTSKMLPKRSYLSFSLLSHIHLHSKSQSYFSHRKVQSKTIGISKNSLLALGSHLSSSISRLQWKNKIASTWQRYYCDNNYSNDAFEHNKRIFHSYLDRVRPKTLYDFGSNAGVFSKIAGRKGIITYAFDSDAACIEYFFRDCMAENNNNILPLVMDFSNPSPGIGWAHKERMSFYDRGPADVVSALALIHHLVISCNISLANIAAFFRSLCAYLIIEFIPQTDSQVQRLLSSRKDIFADYNKDSFENIFASHFQLLEKASIVESERTMYLFEGKK